MGIMGEKEKCNQFSLLKEKTSRNGQRDLEKEMLQENVGSAHRHRRIFCKIERKSEGLILM
jgi:hypothetical protein